MPLAFGLSEGFPRFFQEYLSVHGIPVIIFKGDLAFTFFGVGALVLFYTGRPPARYWSVVVAIGLVLWLLASDNRASLLGLIAATGILLAAGKWQVPAALGLTGIVAAMVLALMAVVGNNTWAAGKLTGMADRLHSIVDYRGEGSYMSGDSYYKGHNNQFRAVWWKNIAVETWETNPALGMGFGHDLAGAFLQEYYPEGTAEEFSARSPHNIAITAFGRMGVIGLAVWLTFCAVLMQRTWQTLRRSDDQTGWALWCSLWVILVSATFGVVLEGPMGAVVFWSILGMAHGSTPHEPTDLEENQLGENI
jgi:O-antigen ligase